MSEQHSILAPSSADIWGRSEGCTAYPMMVQRFPELEESDESREGVAAHEIGATLIEQAAIAVIMTAEKFIDKPASNGVIQTAEMFYGARIYANHVINVMRSAAIFGGEFFNVEKRILIKNIHDACYGTPDMWIYDPVKKRLYIWDFKFGFIPVEVFENYQMITYTQGIIDQLGINGHDEQLTEVVFNVIQPRAHHRDGPIRTWSTKLSSLRGHWNVIKSKADIIIEGDTTAHTGEHCRYCPGRHVCEPAIKCGLSLYEITGKPLPVDITPHALGVQLAIMTRARRQLEALETGYREQVERLIKSGQVVPGWMLEQTYGRETWSKPIPEILTLGKLLGVDLKKPDDAITPTQAKKLGVDAGVITAYSQRHDTGMKLAQDTGVKTSQLFGVI